MLRRVGIKIKPPVYEEVEDRITPAELNHLNYHVAQYKKSKKVSPKALKRLYGRLPDDFKYTGPIYRGMVVQLGDMEKLLNNQAFQGSDTRELVSVQSWTKKFSVTKEVTTNAFGQMTLGWAEYAGIVLESDTGQEEVVIEYDNDIAQYIYDYVRFNAGQGKWDTKKFSMNKLDTLYGFGWLNEVGVLNTGGKRYTLCEDVIVVRLPYDFVERWDQSLVEMVWSHVSEEDKQKVERDYEDKLWLDFKCDGGGNLKYEPDLYPY